MQILRPRTHLDPALAASCTIAALVLAGMYALCAAYANRIDASHLRSEMMYAATVSNRKRIAAQERLELQRPAALAYVRRFARARSGSQAIAAFLSDVESAARASGVEVGGIERLTRLPPASAAAPAAYLGSDAVDVKARGTFDRLLQFEQAMTRGSTLVSVDGIDFTATPASSSRTSVLTAQIDATVYHLSAIPDQEKK